MQLPHIIKICFKTTSNIIVPFRNAVIVEKQGQELAPRVRQSVCGTNVRPWVECLWNLRKDEHGSAHLQCPCTYCELGSRGKIPRSSWTCELNIVKGKLLRQPVSKKVEGKKKCCLTATNVSWDVYTCTLYLHGGRGMRCIRREWDCMLQIYLYVILIRNSKFFPGLSSLGNGWISPGPHDHLKGH